MTSCPPPPAPLVAIVEQATQLVSARIAPIQPPRVCLDPSLPAGSGMSTPGTVSFPAADAGMFAQPAVTWATDRPIVVLHEVLHQVGMSNGLEGGAQMDMEEGLTEAVAHDLRPAWLRAVRGRDAAVPLAYRGQVTRVRQMSAQATRRAWTSSAARAWRTTVIAMPPSERPAM